MNDVIKYAITNYVIKYAITNDVIKYAITYEVIKFAITNDVIIKKIKNISCFQIRVRNYCSKFCACYKVIEDDLLFILNTKQYLSDIWLLR